MLHSHYLNKTDFVANVQSVWLPSAIGNLTVLKYIMTSFLEISLKGCYIFQLDTNKLIALNKFLLFPGKVTLQNVRISLAPTVGTSTLESLPSVNLQATNVFSFLKQGLKIKK